VWLVLRVFVFVVVALRVVVDAWWLCVVCCAVRVLCVVVCARCRCVCAVGSVLSEGWRFVVVW